MHRHGVARPGLPRAAIPRREALDELEAGRGAVLVVGVGVVGAVGRAGGVLVAGFSTGAADRPYDTDTYDEHCAAAGLELVERFSTWDRRRWEPGAGYAVSVHARRS